MSVCPFRSTAASRDAHESKRRQRHALTQARETQAAVAAELERIRQRDARAARRRQVLDRAGAAALVFGAVFATLLGNRVPVAIAATFAGALVLSLAGVALAAEQLTSGPGVQLRAWARCAWRGQHQPLRNFIGGFRCADCGARGWDLDEMGFRDQGYVSPERPVFERTPERMRAQRVVTT